MPHASDFDPDAEASAAVELQGEWVEDRKSDCGKFLFSLFQRIWANDIPNVDYEAHLTYNQLLGYGVSNLIVAFGSYDPGRTATYASADIYSQTATLYSPFFYQEPTAQAQIVLHEFVHLASGSSDIEIAQALGVFDLGNRDPDDADVAIEAAFAWDRELRDHCK